MSIRAQAFEYRVGGSLREDDLSYVERPVTERLLLDSLRRGEYCYILNARQMGKSSLRHRASSQLRREGVNCVSLDLQALVSTGLTEEQLCHDVISEVAAQTKLWSETWIEEWWKEHAAKSGFRRLNLFFDLLLDQWPAPVVVFIDEIDKLLSLEYRDDLFLRIRSYYERRPVDARYNRLSFVLIGVTSPIELVSDKQKSPFNIGIGIPLGPLEFEQARDVLTPGLEANCADPQAVLRQIFSWTGGQPFLTQKLCQLVAREAGGPAVDREASWVEQTVRTDLIESQAFRGEAHISNIRRQVLPDAREGVAGEARSATLLSLYRRVLKGEVVRADGSKEQIELKLTGLVLESEGVLRVANRIYEAIFDLAWIDQSLADLRPYSAALSEWLKGNRSDDYALRGKALQRAREWSSAKNLTEDDRAFLRACERAEAVRQAQRRWIVILAIAAFIAIALAAVAWFQAKRAEVARREAVSGASEAQHARQFAEESATKAKRQEALAKKALAEADAAKRAEKEALQQALQATQLALQQARINQSHNLARAASLDPRSDPQRALLLALYAWHTGDETTPDLIDGLRSSVLSTLIQGRGSTAFTLSALSFLADGTLITGARYPQLREAIFGVGTEPATLAWRGFQCEKESFLTAVSISSEEVSGVIGCSDGELVA